MHPAIIGIIVILVVSGIIFILSSIKTDKKEDGPTAGYNDEQESAFASEDEFAEFVLTYLKKIAPPGASVEEIVTLLSQEEREIRSSFAVKTGKLSYSENWHEFKEKAAKKYVEAREKT